MIGRLREKKELQTQVRSDFSSSCGMNKRYTLGQVTQLLKLHFLICEELCCTNKSLKFLPPLIFFILLFKLPGYTSNFFFFNYLESLVQVSNHFVPGKENEHRDPELCILHKALCSENQYRVLNDNYDYPRCPGAVIDFPSTKHT